MSREGGGEGAEPRREVHMPGLGPQTRRGPFTGPLMAHGSRLRAQAVKLLPHPHPPVAFGLLNVNPLPCIDEV